MYMHISRTVLNLVFLGTEIEKMEVGEPRKIIILSYMRSGSTLTADIIQQHSRVFYVFEPLYSLEKIIRGFLAPVYLNKPSR